MRTLLRVELKILAVESGFYTVYLQNKFVEKSFIAKFRVRLILYKEAAQIAPRAEKKMTKFDVYCDSGANVPLHLVKERGIKVIPYSFTIDGNEQSCYSEEGDFAEIAKKFYADMRAGVEAKTSLVSSQKIKDAVLPSLQSGRDVLITLISSGISGSYNQAKRAAEELMAEFPERKVMVCDSANASMGEGLQVLRACDLRDLGESVEACAQWIESNKYKINSFLTVGDLKYLKRSGRISSTLAIAGTLLNIKPVLTANGENPAKIVFFSKERGRKKALAALAENFVANVVEPSSQTVAICHTDCEEDALCVAEMVKERGAKEVIVEYYDLCTGSHIGPGTVALFFYGKDRQTGVKPKEGILSKLKNKIKHTT